MQRRLQAVMFSILVIMMLATPFAFADDETPPVKDEGNNIYMVDATQGEIPNLLPAEEGPKIATLQRAPLSYSYYLVSPASPDDQTMLVSLDGVHVSFLNIRDGGIIPIRFNRAIIPISNFVWADDDTLTGYVLTVQRNDYAAVAVCFDRRNGSATTGAQCANGIGQPPPGSFPVLISPNRRKVLLAEPPPQAENDNAFTAIVPSAADDLAVATDHNRQAPFRALFADELAANPQARALADFAAMFDPVSRASALVADQAKLTIADLETGEVRDVLTLAKGAGVLDASFSEDGSKFSIITQGFPEDPERNIYDGALISTYSYRDVTGNLAPAQNPFLQDNVLTMLDFGSGATTAWRAADGDGSVYAASSWSTDNQTLALKLNQPGRAKGRRFPQYINQFHSGSSLRLYNNELKEFARVNRVELSDPNLEMRFVSPDELILSSHYRLDQQPWYFNWRSGELRNIADRPGSFAWVMPTNHSREIIFAYSSFTDPVDFYRMNWDGQAFARLTWNNEEVRTASQTKQYPVSFTLSDRSVQHGVLLLPADVPFPPKRVPIVVWQEGGPTTTVDNTWLALTESPFALLPNFGFGVLIVPLYGRYGLGPNQFNALADRANFGQVDIDAQAAIAKQLRTRGWASKVGIVGCSYGGYFVTQSITRHPTTYDAAHAMCSLVDVFTEWTRGFDTLAPWFEGLPPQSAISEYQRDSPAYNANRVRTPLLAFHGTEDFLPVTLMENFMNEVINNKVPAKLLKFKDAGHGFLRPPITPALSRAYELYGAQEQITWFRTYLGK